MEQRSSRMLLSKRTSVAEQRIMALALQCLFRARCQESVRLLRRISDRLDNWTPITPVLIHGDLWTGNTHCCVDNQPGSLIRQSTGDGLKPIWR